MDRKKILAVIVILILILIGFGIYFYSSKNGATPIDGEFPGGGAPAGDFGVDGERDDVNISITTEQGGLPRLYELHKVPVSGVGFYEAGRSEGAQILARYIERALGHIYDTDLSSYSETRILNETRSEINEALWGENGQSLIVRSLDEINPDIIKSSIINLATSTIQTGEGESTLLNESQESPLPDDIPFMAVSEDSSGSLFYLQNTLSSASGVLKKFRTSSAQTVFSSIFTEWLPQFPNKNLVTLTTRPSYLVPGHLFFLNPNSESLTKILSDINGLTTLTNRTGELVLYSKSGNKTVDLLIYNVLKRESINTYLETLPEKCVWGKKDKNTIYCAVPKGVPKGDYPDQWYQGFVSFSDDLWRIDGIDGVAEKILVTENLGAPNLDMTNLAISSGDEYLVFMNKVSGTPWVYRLIEEAPKPPIVNQEPEPTAQKTEPEPSTVVVDQALNIAAPVTEGMVKIR